MKRVPRIITREKAMLKTRSISRSSGGTGIIIIAIIRITAKAIIISMFLERFVKTARRVKEKKAPPFPIKNM
jgi:hypothetical protein